MTEELTSFSVYPQPATDKFYIDFGRYFLKNKDYKIVITNLLGDKIYQSPIVQEATLVDDFIFVPGIYFAVVVNEKGQLLKKKKIIISR